MFVEIRQLLWQGMTWASFKNTWSPTHKNLRTQMKILLGKVKLLELCFIICQLQKIKFMQTFFIIINLWGGLAILGFKSDLSLQQPSLYCILKAGDAWILMYFLQIYVIMSSNNIRHMCILCLHLSVIEINCLQWFVNRTKQIEH